MSSPILENIIHLIDSKGILQERQLIHRWQDELDTFLSPFTRDLLRHNCVLELGIERGLAFKLIIKRYQFPPVAGLLKLTPSLPDRLREVAEYVCSQQYDFHIGIRVEPDRIARELYVYNKPPSVFSDMLARLDTPPPGTASDLHVSFFGLDEEEGISAYYSSTENPTMGEYTDALTERLSAELKTSLTDCVVGHWEHLRYKDGKWQPGKVGIELVEPGFDVVLRTLSHYQPPWFSYLIPRRKLPQMAIAFKPETRETTWYFTIR